MKFSMIFEAQLANPTPEREHQLLRDCVDQALLAEEAGFDAVWAVEHHALKWYAHMSAPEIFLTWVAARTSRIRIGHGVVCMPFNYNHPMRVAERAAMLDTLSGGRLDLGAGRGGTDQELSLCGVDRDRTREEVEEALRMIGRVWQGEEFEWHGLLDISPHPVIPRPVQEPHPPLYLACTKPETVTLAAEYGVGALILGFSGPDQVAHQRKMYDDAIAARSGDRLVSTVQNTHLSALCPTIVLDDGDDARRIGVRGQRFFQESISHWSRGGPPPAEDTEGHDNAAVIEEMESEKAQRISIGELNVSTVRYSTNHAYGTAARAIEYVEALQQAGADEIMCLIQMGTVPQEVCLETIRQWGRAVIPHFRRGSSQ
jgi:alkanesulfonate monooxygenase SsuD/methylene tetrahydromethanopterin reductase-like flavin-dependent oxidoreductase (luciferase family)